MIPEGVDAWWRIKQKLKGMPFIGPWGAKTFRAIFLARTGYPASLVTRRAVSTALALAVEYVYVAEIEGDIAEFGTFSGETTQAIAAAIGDCETVYGWARRGFAQRTLHLFDSFQGLPPLESPVDKDCVHSKSGTWRPGGCFALSHQDLETALRSSLARERFVIHDGWFRDTVPLLPGRLRLAMVHVDCDLYQSTIEALDPLLSKGQLSPGALLLFDDWNTNRAAQEFGERKAWSDLCARYSIRFSDEGSYGCASRKFIIHSYHYA